MIKNNNHRRYLPTIFEVNELYNLTTNLRRGKIDCKFALVHAKGNVDEAIGILKDKQKYLI